MPQQNGRRPACEFSTTRWEPFVYSRVNLESAIVREDSFAMLGEGKHRAEASCQYFRLSHDLMELAKSNAWL
jgi:hypothetical protein